MDINKLCEEKFNVRYQKARGIFLDEAGKKLDNALNNENYSMVDIQKVFFELLLESLDCSAQISQLAVSDVLSDILSAGGSLNLPTNS